MRLAAVAILFACSQVPTAAQPPARIATPPQLDRDGDDDPEDPGTGRAPTKARFEKVGTPPLALTRICDLTPLGDALYIAHANEPLGSDGATITRYAPPDFTVAFDWNRPGERTRGGGAGQGFLRVHAIDGRLFVADADPPYNGLGIVERGTEGYVFVSARDGSFAPVRMPGHLPPAAPDLADPASKGAAVLPRAYHVIDVIRYRGALYASTGSVPVGERAFRSSASPGALHRASDDGARWFYAIDYPFPYRDGVWRLTYMVRFRDRLYVGIQDYNGREPNDFLIIEQPPGVAQLAREHIRPVRLTATGAAATLRWWVDTRASPHRLYWISWARDGGMLRVTSDGESWRPIALPAGAGQPTDITRFRDAIVILTERGLWRLDGETVTPIATSDQFAFGDLFCAAPLAVFRNELYAGGQRRGTLWKLVE